MITQNLFFGETFVWLFTMPRQTQPDSNNFILKYRINDTFSLCFFLLFKGGNCIIYSFVSTIYIHSEFYINQLLLREKLQEIMFIISFIKHTFVIQ